MNDMFVTLMKYEIKREMENMIKKFIVFVLVISFLLTTLAPVALAGPVLDMEIPSETNQTHHVACRTHRQERTTEIQSQTSYTHCFWNTNFCFRARTNSLLWEICRDANGRDVQRYLRQITYGVYGAWTCLA